jgi:hypothetical protein
MDDRVAGARIFPRNSENFFWPNGARKKRREIHPGGGG